ncbi:YbaN family protein [Cellulosilyticum sp. I15G10I2]|uniref:YbaN family protein n=1 Tax=Cellulosilyticum sp. I15G10I2 TaxID=1892843 RepID=UPI00085BE1F9|nr:YbaN family protein [Cellulosilyticum sp. I15G10I2]
MKIILVIIGTISLALGILGILLPVLPTTPFVLLTIACYLRSSPRLYHLVLSNKYLGPYVKDYVSGKGIPLKAKKKSIFLLWLTIGFSILFIIDKAFVKGMLVVIAACVSCYIWTRKTATEEETLEYSADEKCAD